MTKILSHSFQKLVLFALVSLPFACLSQAAATQDTNRRLKNSCKSYFPMGVAIPHQSELILTQLESVTTENGMKIDPIHREDNQYFWKGADALVNFAEFNTLKVCGHTNQVGWITSP